MININNTTKTLFNIPLEVLHDDVFSHLSSEDLKSFCLSSKRGLGLVQKIAQRCFPDVSSTDALKSYINEVIKTEEKISLILFREKNFPQAFALPDVPALKKVYSSPKKNYTHLKELSHLRSRLFFWDNTSPDDFEKNAGYTHPTNKAYLGEQKKYQDWGKSLKEKPPSHIKFHIKDPIHILPREIQYFLKLEVLKLEDNYLKKLPNELKNCEKLKSLNLNTNEFQEIPPVVFKMKNLIKLDFRSNWITTIPDEISSLENLRVLDLENNEINEVSEKLAECKLEMLDLSKNRLEIKPKATAEEYVYEPQKNSKRKASSSPYNLRSKKIPKTL